MRPSAWARGRGEKGCERGARIGFWMGRQAREAKKGSVDRGIGQFWSSEVEQNVAGIAREHPEWVNSGGGSRKGNWVQQHQELAHPLNWFEGREPAAAKMSTQHQCGLNLLANWEGSYLKLCPALSMLEEIASEVPSRWARLADDLNYQAVRRLSHLHAGTQLADGTQLDSDTKCGPMERDRQWRPTDGSWRALCKDGQRGITVEESRLKSDGLA